MFGIYNTHLLDHSNFTNLPPEPLTSEASTATLVTNGASSPPDLMPIVGVAGITVIEGSVLEGAETHNIIGTNVSGATYHTRKVRVANLSDIHSDMINKRQDRLTMIFLINLHYIANIRLIEKAITT